MKRLSIYLLIFSLVFSMIPLQPSSTLAKEVSEDTEEVSNFKGDLIPVNGETEDSLVNEENSETENAGDEASTTDMKDETEANESNSEVDATENESAEELDADENTPEDIERVNPSENSIQTLAEEKKPSINESNTSLLGHFKSGNAKVYNKIGEEHTLVATNLTNAVYYIKKQANFDGDTYYLISTNPSATKGVIGWVKSADLTTHTHVGVDKKAKTFYIKGNGKTTTKAWGGSKDTVHANLSGYKNKAFQVNLTEKVGSNIWYRGKIDGKGNNVWVHSSYVQNIQQNKTSLLGHIKNRNVIIHKSIGGDTFKAGATYTNAVYYIKAQTTVGKATYYLISNSPSSVNGVVGWVKSTDLSTHKHVGVDKKAKTFFIKGNGKATTKAWGGSKDTVHANLSKFKDQAFQVNLTEKIGNNTWYRGKINGQDGNVWLHSSYVFSETKSKTSLLGHIKNGNVNIYETVGGKASKAGAEFTNIVYYIKEQAVVGKDRYYLISKSPSNTKGVVGWIKSTDLSTHKHVGLDKKAKTFYIKGNGKATTKAWGGSKDTIYADMTKYNNATFKVHLTEKVGNNTWYRGTLDGKTVWLHSSYVYSASKSKTSLLGHIKSGNVTIHETIGGKTFKAGADYTNAVYYIKEQAVAGKNTYYLISKSPSNTKGVVGWVKSTDLSTHKHVGVDKKAKIFFIKGNGKATSKAWGGSKDTIFSDMKQYKSEPFTVHLTEKVGNNTWYRGTLDGKTVWLHSSYLEKTFEQEVAYLTNQERIKAGLAPLKFDEKLSDVANVKARDMYDNDYFDHSSPVYGSPGDMLNAFGVSYSAVGENIAWGYRTPNSVVTGWMNSPGHKANILYEDFTHIGIGYDKRDSHWVQIFISR